MTFFKSLALAFSMFSRIPVPRVAWNEKNMRYMLCAFPLVGAVIGAALVAWDALLQWVECRFGGLPLYVCALGFTLIPVLITGGIHLDGFMDTCDALASHADREKKLAIMHDPHCGAFAVIGCVLYLLSYFVLSSALCDDFLPVLPLFVQSRLLSAFAVATFPLAKDSGLVRTFADASAKRFTAWWCGVWFVAVSVAAIVLFGQSGVAVVVAQLVVFVWYFCMARRNFGGITGDTAGCFVQMAELVSLFALSVVEHIAFLR